MDHPSSEAASRVAQAPAGPDAAWLRLWPAVLAFLLVCMPISFFRLGATDAVTMEGIVADGARGMERTHEYSVPRLHGEIYSYKPPLAYWLALASFRLFGGETEWSLRFPFALSGLVMGLAVLFLTHRVAGPATGLLCAFASMTGIITLQKLHLAEFDMPLAAGVGVAAGVACRVFAGRRSGGGLWLVGYLALALAFLAKGAPAVMFYAPGLLLASWLTGRFRELFRAAHLAGAALFVLVVSGWLASAYRAAGWAAFEQPLAEAHDKGLVWNASLVGSTLAKPLLTAALFLPWTLLLPASFRSRAWALEPARRMALAAAAFATAGVAVFMTVPAAESRYLLPLAAPVGILCGLAARAVSAGRLRRRAIGVFTLLIGLGAVAFALSADSAGVWSRGLLVLVGAGTAVIAVRGLFPEPGWQEARLLAAAAILGWLAQTMIVNPHRASSRSLRAMASSFEAHLDPGAGLWTPPVSKDFRHSSLFFYLRRQVRTLPAEGGGPVAGDGVVLFSDEHRELIASLPPGYEVVERRRQRGDEFVLAKVRPDAY